jgi:hypothetical protein
MLLELQGSHFPAYKRELCPVEMARNALNDNVGLQVVVHHPSWQVRAQAVSFN